MGVDARDDKGTAAAVPFVFPEGATLYGSYEFVALGADPGCRARPLSIVRKVKRMFLQSPLRFRMAGAPGDRYSLALLF